MVFRCQGLRQRIPATAVGGNAMDAEYGLARTFPNRQIDFDAVSFDFFHDRFSHESPPAASIFCYYLNFAQIGGLQTSSCWGVIHRTFFPERFISAGQRNLARNQ
jgi:hypothetical protein